MRAVSQDGCENDAQLKKQRRDRFGHVTLRAGLPRVLTACKKCGFAGMAVIIPESAVTLDRNTQSPVIHRKIGCTRHDLRTRNCIESEFVADHCFLVQLLARYSRTCLNSGRELDVPISSVTRK